MTLAQRQTVLGVATPMFRAFLSAGRIANALVSSIIFHVASKYSEAIFLMGVALERILVSRLSFPQIDEGLCA